MNIVASEIKRIVEEQGYLYFRTVNINDLNQQVGETDILQGIGVYSSLPEIKNNAFGKTNNILMEYAIEVYYLKLNNEIDDKGEAVDVILDSLYNDAQWFYDQIRQGKLIATSQTIDSYQIDAVETLKMTKEVLTGWRIRMTIPIFRKDFICIE